jgi:hypothetical protein
LGVTAATAPLTYGTPHRPSVGASRGTGRGRSHRALGRSPQSPRSSWLFGAGWRPEPSCPQSAHPLIPCLPRQGLTRYEARSLTGSLLMFEARQRVSADHVVTTDRMNHQVRHQRKDQAGSTRAQKSLNSMLSKKATAPKAGAPAMVPIAGAWGHASAFLQRPASEAGGRVGVCPGLYDGPHRRSLTGGAHSSSRLAPHEPTQPSR